MVCEPCATLSTRQEAANRHDIVSFYGRIDKYWAVAEKLVTPQRVMIDMAAGMRSNDIPRSLLPDRLQPFTRY